MPTPDLAGQLAGGLEAMKLALPTEARARLVAYVELLAKWNRAYNLTAVRDPAEMVSRHLLDSLALAPHLGGRSLADLGSGAGLPGIPLAIARPDLPVTLIEANGKKARFLREATRSLPLPNVAVEQARVEDAAGGFDCIATRAFASLADMLARGGHLLAPGGRWLALKGHPSPEEVAAIPDGFRLRAVHPLVVPGADAARCMLELVRAETTARGAAMVV